MQRNSKPGFCRASSFLGFAASPASLLLELFRGNDGINERDDLLLGLAAEALDLADAAFPTRKVGSQVGWNPHGSIVRIPPFTAD
jgi:hypothetical protein